MNRNQHDRRSLRCADRRRRPLRHRRRPPPAGALPRQELRDPRGARGDRRHLGPLPLSRASAPTPTCTRSATASGPGPSRSRSPTGASILATSATPPARAGIDRHIRFSHRVVAADWSSEEARWTVEAERGDTGETVTLTCDFLFMSSGYYRYDQGYTPEFPGIERFGGEVVHPQHWPEDARLRRQAGGRDRQRRHRDDAGPGDGQGRRQGDDAAALAHLRGLDAGRRRARQLPAPPPARTASSIRSCAGRTCSCSGIIYRLSPHAGRS